MASFEEYLRDAIQRHLACNLYENARFLAEQLVAAVPSEVGSGRTRSPRRRRRRANRAQQPRETRAPLSDDRPPPTPNTKHTNSPTTSSSPQHTAARAP